MLKRFVLGMLLVAAVALGAGIKNDVGGWVSSLTTQHAAVQSNQADDEGHWGGAALHQPTLADDEGHWGGAPLRQSTVADDEGHWGGAPLHQPAVA